MGNNFTPLNTQELEKKYGNKTKKGMNLDTILLLIGAFTAIVLVFMLFVLIQKKMQATSESQTASTVPAVITPIRKPAKTVSPTPLPTAIDLVSLESTASASISASPVKSLISPSVIASPSATASPTFNNNQATPSVTTTP